MDTGRNFPEGEASPAGFAGPEPDAGWVRLPGPPDAPGAGGRETDGPRAGGAGAESTRVRSDGVRHVRRMSNLAAAALIVGTGASAVALAHHSLSGTAPAAGAAATTGIGGTAAVNGASGPQVSHSVATTSGSGVVTTTQTKVVNGKVVVTQVRHAAPYHDN